MTVTIHQFENNQRLSEALAECVASGLEGALALRDVATLAVSGGSTPQSRRPLWSVNSTASKVSALPVMPNWP